ncbi:MAG TPA: MFS transporter [Gemmatimonadales bacterium]|jgi:MHS family proline/betaine transporter-like MFS transporter|nr:MFS transporter [Gemmatimonadales bacterium]
MTATATPLTPAFVHTQEFHTPASVRRGVIAGVVGNMLEWYDFALFGFFARQIGTHFFPAGNPTASLLAAFGTFAAGFLMRPVGGALFGWIGDRFGRKEALVGSVLAMAFPSFFIGLLPGAATIGLAAPILLVLFRMLQGVSVGGEYMASAVFLVEGSAPGHRGWMGSWGPFGAASGTLLGSAAGWLVNASMSPEAVNDYGWRIPFLVGLLVGLGGLAIRRHYVERVPQQAPAKSPLSEALRAHWRTMAHLVALTAGISVGFYTTFVYSAIWLQQVAQVPAIRAFELNTIAMMLLLVITPVAGLASDRLGRRVVLAWAAGGLALLAWPLMALMAHGTPLAILGGQMGLALLVGTTGAVLPAAMAELAPWRVRCTVLSVGYNVSLALLGGTTPMIAAWLVARTQVNLAPGIYLALAATVTFLGALLLPGTARHRMTQEFQAARPR